MRTARWTLIISFVALCGGYQLLLFGAMVLVGVFTVQAMYFPLPRKRTGRGLGPPPGWRPRRTPALSLTASSSLILREI